MSSKDNSGCARRSGRSAVPRTVLAGICLAAAAMSAVMLLENAREDRESGEVYASLEQFLTFPAGEPSPSDEQIPAAPPGVSAVPQSDSSDAERAAQSAVPERVEPEGVEPSAAPLPEADFEALRAINPDTVAWIRIEGTSLSLPVVQAEDNEYYLDHIFDGSRSSVGCPYLDCGNSPDFSDSCSIIYGHNRRNGAMFAPLLGYAEQSWFDEHPSVTLILPDGGYTVRIFSVLYADPDEAGSDTSPWRRSFESEEEFFGWAAALAARSVVDCGDTPSGGRVLVLSTCDNSPDGRFVVLGRIPEEPDAPTNGA